MNAALQVVQTKNIWAYIGMWEREEPGGKERPKVFLKFRPQFGLDLAAGNSKKKKKKTPLEHKLLS